MVFAFSIGLLSLLALGGARSTHNNSSLVANVTAAFHQSQVVPDVISTFKPLALLDVFFNNSASTKSVHVLPGAQLAPKQTRTAPQYCLTFNTTIRSSNASWVITIVDPDAPSRQNPTVAQYLHFMGQDFKLSATTDGNSVLLTNSSSALVEFAPPGPPPGSGPHRYVVLAYVQPHNFTTVARTLLNITSPANITRQSFDIESFAKSASLGTPIAGTFFSVEQRNSTSTTRSASASATGVPPPGTTPISTVVSTAALLTSTPSGSSSPSSTQQSTSGAAKIVNGWSTVALIVLSVVGGYLA